MKTTISSIIVLLLISYLLVPIFGIKVFSIVCMISVSVLMFRILTNP